MNASNPGRKRPGSQLTNLLKDYLSKWDIDRISLDAARHYRILRLVDPAGNYLVPSLEAFVKRLSPDAISVAQIHSLLDVCSYLLYRLLSIRPDQTG